MESRISLVTLGVADVARARRFYEALGWKASSASNADVAFFQLGGLALSLYGLASLAQDMDRRFRMPVSVASPWPIIYATRRQSMPPWLRRPRLAVES